MIEAAILKLAVGANLAAHARMTDPGGGMRETGGTMDGLFMMNRTNGE